MRTMGVKQVAVIINKMDTVDYKEDAFEKTKVEVAAVLKQAGFKVDTITFLAVSGFKGDNVVKKSANMPWYKGPTILEQMDLFTLPEKLTTLPLRMPLQDVYEITGIGTVPVGKIATGTMKLNQKVVILPADQAQACMAKSKPLKCTMNSC